MTARAGAGAGAAGTAARGGAARSGFIPALEGMRALAAVGVMTTHVAFQTGNAVDSVAGRVFGRLDLAVALFFALSGFLLWRPHAQAARGLRPRPPTARYYRSRLVRIMPAYLVLVVAVLWLLPVGGGTGSATASVSTWFANLTLTQVYVPYALTAGLTQLWSLSVEMTFYLVLPLVAWLMVRLRGGRTRLRVPLLAAVGVAGLFWGYVDLPVPDGVNTDTWLQGHAAWFAAGMVLAELAAAAMMPVSATQRPGRLRRLIARPVPMLGVALAAYALACTDLAGPPGLVEPAPWQYACKIGLGAVIGFALLAPLTLAAPGGERDRGAHRWLSSPVALALGRWSYALFLWHVAVLAMVFPAFGLPVFGGHMLFVWVATLVLSILVSAASYALVEEPARRALVRWEARRDTVRRAHARTRPETGTADTPAAATPISAKT
ncbi:acyltransferase family protein [Tomitella gaofuii]|uniref:acyltransferase family protein n=1 Tax=Tomitella gaofuii TaxID=2760083 RepID=UPI0015F7DCB3|nr:acyltransferase [Tomitella gaofuii]